MVRNEYTQKLEKVKENIIVLLNDSLKMLDWLFDSIGKDIDLTEPEQLDKEVRKKTKEMLDLCTEIVTLQQPMATDIRLIISAIRIKNDIERSVRDSLHILELLHSVSGAEEYRPEFEQNREILVEMITILIESITKENSEILLKLNDLDEKIDIYYDQTNRKIRERIREGTEHAEQFVDILLTIRMIERIADHYCNIAEKIYYVLTAEVIRIA